MLNILIPSIPERKKELSLLCEDLDKQIEYCINNHRSLGCVTYIIDDSKRFLDGGLDIGGKRDALLKKSTAKYVCFLDDDDSISPNYVEALLRLCNEGADVCTFKSLFKCDTFWTVINMRLGVENEQACPNFEVKRNVWHICPIKRDLAIHHSFIKSNYGEDWDWIKRVLMDIKTEVHSNEIIHNYNHYKSKSEADKIS